MGIPPRIETDLFVYCEACSNRLLALRRSMSRDGTARHSCECCKAKRVEGQVEPGVIACPQRFTHDLQEKSWEELVAELSYLRRCEKQNDALLNALSRKGDSDSYYLVADGLLDKSKTREELYSLLLKKGKASTFHQRRGGGELCSIMHAEAANGPDTEQAPGVCRPLNQQHEPDRASTQEATKTEGSELE